MCSASNKVLAQYMYVQKKYHVCLFGHIPCILISTALYCLGGIDKPHASSKQCTNLQIYIVLSTKKCRQYRHDTCMFACQ